MRTFFSKKKNKSSKIADEKGQGRDEVKNRPSRSEGGKNAAADKGTGGGAVRKRPLWSLLVYIGVCVALIVCVAVFLKHLSLWINLGAYAILLVLIICAFVTFFLNKPALFRLCITATISLSFILFTYIILDQTGVFDTLTNMELIKNFILSTGIWGRVVFVAVQTAQVVFLPIPGVLVNLTGVALYGTWQGFLLSLIGTILGSVIAFTVGKLFGKKLVSWIVGKEDADKYRKLFDKKGRFVFILMLIFPIFPDDMLCMIAGITTMSYGYFFLAVLLTRPWGLATTCFLGSGEIIPFRGWGLAVWAVIFILLGLAFYFINKYNKQIMAYINKLAGKFSNKIYKKADKGLLAEAADIEPDTKIFAKPPRKTSGKKRRYKKRN